MANSLNLTFAGSGINARVRDDGVLVVDVDLDKRSDALASFTRFGWCLSREDTDKIFAALSSCRK